MRRLAPAMILALGALLLGGRRDQERPAPRAALASLPESLGAFRGTDLVISDEEQRVAGMSEYMFRQYSRGSSAAFSVYVGYYAYQLQGRTIHSPKNCLPGAGWQALGTGTESIVVGEDAFPVNRYLLTNGTERALVYYWYQGRGRVAASEFAVKWDLLRDATLRGRSEEALVRIVVPVGPMLDSGAGATTVELEAADQIAADAAALIIPRVTDVLPAWEFSGARATSANDGT